MLKQLLYMLQDSHAICLQVRQLQAGFPSYFAEGQQDAEKTAERFKPHF
jgi:hypothetical protein